MNRYKKATLSIIYENLSKPNKLELKKESIIVKKTIFGRYKDISSGIKFKPTTLKDEIVMDNYPSYSNTITRPFGGRSLDSLPPIILIGPSGEVDLNHSEMKIYDKLINSIKTRGFTFILSDNNNDFSHLRTPTPQEVESYLNSVHASCFHQMLIKYNKEDKKNIKKAIKVYKKGIK